MSQPTVFDRNFQFGDGVFTTIKVQEGTLQLWSLHWQRLVHSCQRLGINLPSEDEVFSKAQGAISAQEQVMKIVVSRGHGGRGYSTKGIVGADVYMTTSPMPVFPWLTQGISLGVAQMKLGIQPLLAGIKHCSRLETVLLKTEVEQSDFDDLVVTDTDGCIIECAAANLFFLLDDKWHTPSLHRAGVNGVMRQHILSQVDVIEGDFSINSLAKASAILTCNALTGVVPVRSFQGKKLDTSAVFDLKSAL